MERVLAGKYCRVAAAAAAVADWLTLTTMGKKCQRITDLSDSLVPYVVVHCEELWDGLLWREENFVLKRLVIARLWDPVVPVCCYNTVQICSGTLSHIAILGIVRSLPDVSR